MSCYKKQSFKKSSSLWHQKFAPLHPWFFRYLQENTRFVRALFFTFYPCLLSPRRPLFPFCAIRLSLFFPSLGDRAVSPAACLQFICFFSAMRSFSLLSYLSPLSFLTAMGLFYPLVFVQRYSFSLLSFLSPLSFLPAMGPFFSSCLWL
jgi:hypothetical protein